MYLDVQVLCLLIFNAQIDKALIWSQRPPFSEQKFGLETL